MPAARSESLAGKLLQIQTDALFVGAGLPANVGVREGLWQGAIRLQASSYKYKPMLPL